MVANAIIYPTDKAELYHLLEGQIKAMTESIPHMVSNLANISAVLGSALSDINWVGFYLMEQGQFVWKKKNVVNSILET